jgi:phospholipid:diacylglycerol acyltransferase
LNGMPTKTKNGVKLGNGDGTIPLLSLGYMCRNGWVDNAKLNPSAIKIRTREFENAGGLWSDINDPLRGGPNAADHVDIMGNVKMVEDIVRIATGWGADQLEDRIISDIDELGRVVDVRNGKKGGGGK